MPNLPDQETDAKLMPGEAASILGVTTKTLTAMTKLHPIILPSGHRRYLKAEVEALLNPPVDPVAQTAESAGVVSSEKRAS